MGERIAGASLAEEKQQGKMLPAAMGDQLRQGAAPVLYPERAGSHQATEVGVMIQKCDVISEEAI